MGTISERIEVEYNCGHKMIYDLCDLQWHGEPKIGEVGRCHQCKSEFGLPLDSVVKSLRQCWLETTTKVLYEEPLDKT